MSAPKVLLIGLHPSSVDYTKWPELSPEKLNNAFEQARAELEAAGFEGAWCLTDTGESAGQQVSTHLESFQPQVVMIGAGVRTDPDLLPLFEKILNIIHLKAPHSKIAFNTSPYDTVEAIQRWI